MNTETLNFIVGWLAGLVPTILTILIGYRIQLIIEQRKRKTEVLYRRLDQAEKYVDRLLDFALEADGVIEEGIRAGKVDWTTLRPKLEEIHHERNIFTVIYDDKLDNFESESMELLKSLVNIMHEVDKLKKKRKEAVKEGVKHKLRVLIDSFLNWNANVKRRLDFIRASDPNKYFSKDISEMSLEEKA